MFLTGYHVVETIVFSAFAFGAAAAYHLHLYWKSHRRPEETLIGYSNHLREIWVEMIVREQRDLLAVQTLRNWTMAATFLASTAVLIWLAMIHVTFSAAGGPELCGVFTGLAADSPAWWTAKWSILMLNVFFAFVNFTLAIRHFNHVGFLINLPPGSDRRVDTAFVAKRLNRGATHHTLGMRGYYFAVPLVLWLFGPVLLLAATLLLLVLLYRIDHKL